MDTPTFRPPRRILATVLLALLVASIPWYTPSATAQTRADSRTVTETTAKGQRAEREFAPSGILLHEVLWSTTRGQPTKDRELVFSDSGILLKERAWDRGEPVLELDFLPSGQLKHKREITGSGAGRRAEVWAFFDSGILATNGRFAVSPGGSQVPVGVHREFAASGLLARETQYTDTGRLMWERQWDSAGQLVRDEEVLANGTRRPYVR